jgi:hypothetical protein
MSRQPSGAAAVLSALLQWTSATQELEMKIKTKVRAGGRCGDTGGGGGGGVPVNDI